MFLTVNMSYAYINVDDRGPDEKKKKDGFLTRLIKKDKKDSKGYYGTLPKIEDDFKDKPVPSSVKTNSDMEIPTEELNEADLKKAPYNDPLFLDNVVKKQKTSNYVNDIQKTKFALTSLKKCIEEQGDIQRFNACVNMVDLYSTNLQKKYENESDSLRESYSYILNTNYQAKILGNLLYDANYYARYVPTNQGQYSKTNIDNKKEDLLNRINKTLFLISSET